MKKVIIFVIFIVLVVGAVLIFDKGKLDMKKDSQKDSISEDRGPIREPAVAGAFYPGSKEELEEMVDEYLSKAEISGVGKYVNALIVPHAGYVYSGWVAAYAYKTLIGSPPAGGIKIVVLIGNSHQEYFDGISVYPEGYFKTPLGNVEIDKEFAKKLMDADKKIYFRESAHEQEHSLEVQLPFLQRVFSAQGGPASGWKIVPIIIGNQPDTVEVLINALKDLIDDNTLLIASSDLSHYPKYEDAQYSDGKVIEAILTGNRDKFKQTIADLEQENIPNLQTCACGHDSIEVVMALMEGKNAKLLKYANSGDVSIGDKSQVVGYAAIVFSSDKKEEGELNKTEQKRLLDIAREAVETYIREGKTIDVKENMPNLNKHRGAFVTLKKHGELRGCIGLFEPDMPLYKVVIEMGIAAATEDHRFPPVIKDELGDLEYEVSVLSPLKKVDSWENIEIGKHGVKIVKGFRSGVFLPQVATENNWDLDTFMSVLCTQKAGLPSNCWKDPETEIYVFTAQVFSEEDIRL